MINKRLGSTGPFVFVFRLRMGNMIRYLTAGESHGPQLTAIVEGLPAGVPVAADEINAALARRQGGYGRGGRMKIEKDTVQILSGVRWGKSLGSPVTLVVSNRDWVNWEKKMSVEAIDAGAAEAVTRPRPGHADLPGALKYRHDDVRNILERSSARETAARVAVGGVATSFLRCFGISIVSHVTEIGGIKAAAAALTPEEIAVKAAGSELYMADPEAEQQIKDYIDKTKDAGDTLGGVVEVITTGLPPGLGTHVQWDRKLDARLAMAVMSVQAIKGVEIGIGFEAARAPGSAVHDEIFHDPERKPHPFYRTTNRAGGLEGGMTNGEPVVIRAAMKPIPTLYTPLRSIDLATKEPFEAAVERSDVCAVPAAAVVVEAAVAVELVNAFMEKFGGDSLEEIRENYENYLCYLETFA